jgi:hypothetical protein
MEYKKPGLETHPQEHRFESRRAARQRKANRRTVLARKGSLRRAYGRPCPLRAVLQPIKTATGGSGGNSNHSRCRTIPKGAGFQPAEGLKLSLDISSLLMEGLE